MPPLTVAEIASLCGGVPSGDLARPITAASAIETALPTDVSFADGKKALATAASSNAGCLLVSPAFDLTGPWALVRVANPRAAFARILASLYPPKKSSPAIHPTAVIAAGAKISPDVWIGPHAVVGENTVIESRCSIGASCTIGDHVHIGLATVLHSNVTVYDRISIGARVIIHAGCVLGADGFGFALVNGRYEKFPQVGTVHIEDDVEIGANCCIDRAALGVTRIGKGAKLDNLVHVAHNCNLGEHVVVAAQTGFSGSVTVGDFAMIGGQAGIGEKAFIESKAIVGGKAGILTSATVHAGEPVWGIPARPLRKHLKGLANVARLPELKEQVHELRQKLALLEGELKKTG
jgi:UDP-3-O-[3-hydroxymyristoyl] glucosamine N-acyltransferase